MINNNLFKDLGRILSRREIDVVRKRLNGKKINQTESNYLSRSVRPKLKAAQKAVSFNLLNKLVYRRKKYERTGRVLRNIILNNIFEVIDKRKVKAVVLYGSYIRNYHVNYRDIDIIVVLRSKIWDNSVEKIKLERDIENRANLNLDVNVIFDKDLQMAYSYSPLFQTEFESYEVIYGILKLNRKREINKDYLYVKLLEIEPILELWRNLSSRHIYNSLRSCLAIYLFLEKKFGNELILKIMEDNIGKSTVEALAENRANKIQREMGIRYLKYLYDLLETNLK